MGTSRASASWPSTGYLDHEAGGTTEADVNVLGPIARSAEDLELLLGLIARKEGPLVAALDAPPEDTKALKVAAWLDDDFCPVDQSVIDVMSAAVDKLEAAGVAVDRNARPNLDPNHSFGVGAWLVTAAMTQSMSADNLEGADMDNALGGASHREWLDMHAERETIRRLWAEFFKDYDALLMPTTFCATISAPAGRALRHPHPEMQWRRPSLRGPGSVDDPHGFGLSTCLRATPGAR